MSDYMCKNLDIKINNANMKMFLENCKEMEGTIFPILQEKGYTSNFYVTPLGCFASGKTVYSMFVDFGNVPIPISISQEDDCFYLHDDYDFKKDGEKIHDAIYNEQNNVFDVLKVVASTFENVTILEQTLDYCTRYENKETLFGEEKEEEVER